MIRTRSTAHDAVPARALLLSIAALAVPLVVPRIAPEVMPLYQPLLWMTALIPPFLLSYYKGWKGAALAFAIGMAMLSLWNAGVMYLGRTPSDDPLLLLLAGVYVVITVAVGWTTELLHQARDRALGRAVDLVMGVEGGTVAWVSETCERILGVAEERVRGRRLEELVHPADRSQVPLLLDAAAVTGLQSRRELRTGGIAEGWRTLEVIREDEAVPRRAGHVRLRARDITELKLVEEQTRRAAHMELLSRITAGVAHDFNNIFTTIQGHAEMLRVDLGGQRQLASVEEIRRAADRLGALVNQLLAYTRQQALNPRTLSLEDLVATHAPTLQQLLGERIGLHVLTDNRLRFTRADPAQLRNALLTLAARARRVMPDGGNLVIQTSSAELTSEQSRCLPYPVQLGRYVVLTITDDGPLLPQEVREHIFEPFANGDESTGLELSSVYGFVKQSGGYIWADPGADRGTTFSIYLPSVQAEPVLDVQGTPSAAGQRVMVVEDDVAVRSLVRVLLLRRGFSVLEASDGQDASDVMSALDQPLDLLITDIRMPRMRGETLVANARRRQPDLRVLFMSGYAPERAVPTGTDARAAFLQKPFSPEELLHAVSEALVTNGAVSVHAN